MIKIKNSPVYDRLNDLTWFTMDKVSDFSPLDWAFVKAALVSFGILIGAAFYKNVSQACPSDSGHFYRLIPLHRVADILLRRINIINIEKRSLI